MGDGQGGARHARRLRLELRPDAAACRRRGAHDHRPAVDDHHVLLRGGLGGRLLCAGLRRHDRRVLRARRSLAHYRQGHRIRRRPVPADRHAVLPVPRPRRLDALPRGGDRQDRDRISAAQAARRQPAHRAVERRTRTLLQRRQPRPASAAARDGALSDLAARESARRRARRTDREPVAVRGEPRYAIQRHPRRQRHRQAARTGAPGAGPAAPDNRAHRGAGASAGRRRGAEPARRRHLRLGARARRCAGARARQPRLQCAALHADRRRADRRAPPRRPDRRGGGGHRHRHCARTARLGVPGILPGRQSRTQQRPRLRAGARHSPAPVRRHELEPRAAVRTRPRLGLRRAASGGRGRRAQAAGGSSAGAPGPRGCTSAAP